MDHEASRIRSKRPFSQVDDTDECVPISKRINNLNIKGPRSSQEEPSTSLQPDMEGAFGMNNGPPHHHHQLPGMSGSTPLTYHQPHFPDPAAMYQHMNPHAPGFPYQALPGPRPPLELYQGGAQAAPYFHQPLPLTPPTENPPVIFHHGIEEDEQMGEEEEKEYDPELGETENPHYYHINRLLFEAHSKRRTRREGDPLDSDPPPSFLPC